MQLSVSNMNKLFDQLGEPSDLASIDRFIEAHRPLAGAVQLHEAPFWTPAQARFLCEAIRDDADWAPIVDELNAELHSPHH